MSRKPLWIFVRQPLLLLFAMGFLLSLASSPRLSLRTTVDGMISFAFLVAAQLAAIAFVYLRSDRSLPFADVVDRFFATNTPWLLWILVFAAWNAVSPAGFISMRGAYALIATLLVPAAWAAYLDLNFFRIVLNRRAVVFDLVAARAISWTIAIGYFFGIALWAQVVAWLR